MEAAQEQQRHRGALHHRNRQDHPKRKDQPLISCSDKNKCDKKAYEIIEQEQHENGADPQTLKISAPSRSVNRHGIGLERLIVPILMNGGQGSREICEQLLKINPSAWKVRQMYGECLLRQGKWRAGFTEQWANLINTTSIPRKPWNRFIAMARWEKQCFTAAG